MRTDRCLENTSGFTGVTCVSFRLSTSARLFHLHACAVFLVRPGMCVRTDQRLENRFKINYHTVCTGKLWHLASFVKKGTYIMYILYMRGTTLHDSTGALLWVASSVNIVHDLVYLSDLRGVGVGSRGSGPPPSPPPSPLLK